MTSSHPCTSPVAAGRPRMGMVGLLSLLLLLAACGGLGYRDGANSAHRPSADFARGMAAYDLGNYRGALVILRPIAEAGDPDAQTYLGVMYREGRGLPRDHVEAVAWFYKAARQNHALAQYNLGIVWASGIGVPRNDEAAVKWYRLAATQGLSEAQFALGYMYAHGRGGERDPAEARRWYEAAAVQGNTYAMNNLGELYASGAGGTADMVAARRWYRTWR